MSRSSWTVLLVLSAAGIATFYPLVKILNGAIDAHVLAFLRFLVAALVLLPVLLATSYLRVPFKRDWAPFLSIALLGIGANVLVIIGIGQTNSVVSAILLNTNPLIVALLAPLVIDEQLTLKKVIALVVGFFGVILVILNGQDVSTLVHSEYFWGSLIVLVAALFSGLNKIVSKGLVRRYDGLFVTFIGVALGALLLGIMTATNGTLPEIASLTAKEMAIVLLIGIIASAIPWAIWNSSLKHLDVHVAASFMLLIPIFATLYSLLFLRETFTIWMLVGLLLTSLAIYFVQREVKIIQTPQT
ncbi:DMT family transporter [Candidatus Kaiserbacteria bacterium]|nr:DMT family transporter [Candidatus Kaiserbacteria bacterium]